MGSCPASAETRQLPSELTSGLAHFRSLMTSPVVLPQRALASSSCVSPVPHRMLSPETVVPQRMLLLDRGVLVPRECLLPTHSWFP